MMNGPMHVAHQDSMTGSSLELWFKVTCSHTHTRTYTQARMLAEAEPYSAHSYIRRMGKDRMPHVPGLSLCGWRRVARVLVCRIVQD